MKNIFTIFISVIMIVSMFAVPMGANADADISVVINGVAQRYDVMPQIVNGRTLVPMRGIFEALGAEVTWIDATDTVVGSRDRKFIKLRLDSDVYYINGVEQSAKIDVPAQIIGGRTMVPVRFIAETLGESVGWDADTKTVTIDSEYLRNVAVSDKLDTLPSTMHRDIPREFKKTSDLNDLIYYEEDGASVADDNILSKLPEGKEVFTNDEFVSLFSFNESGKGILEDQYGSAEVVSVEGQSFNNALKVVTHTVPEKSTSHTAKFGNILEGRCEEGDNLLFTCKVRLTEGGVSGVGQMYPSIQENVSGKHRKILFRPVFITEKWQTIYIPIAMLKDYTNVDFRFGQCAMPQTVEIAELKILNYGKEITGDYRLPENDGSAKSDILKGASWRDEAIKNIEKVRKGDFRVVVKDKNGNPVNNANITFDMFESEIPLGTTLNVGVLENGNPKIDSVEYNKNMSKYFNAAVAEHHMKWGPYEQDNGETARKIVNVARDNGMIYFRGHVMIMDYHKNGTSGTVFIPDDVVSNYSDEEYIDKRTKEWIYKVSDMFAGEVYQWDVGNELILSDGPRETGFYKNMGSEYYDKILKWAREVNPDSELILLEGSRMITNYLQFKTVAEKLLENEHTFDSVACQGHIGGEWIAPSQYDNIINEYAKLYNGNFAITEYTINTGDEIYDANYTRDFFITCLANENINMLCLWGYRRSKPDSAPVLVNADYTLTKAGEQIVDLYYNKCFTHDVNVTTDSNGECSIRGFYGSYDVTVDVNGTKKTVMAAFHKDFENVLEIVIE